MVDFPGRKEIVAGVRTVLGPSGKELGELIADRVRFWRWRQLVKIMERAAELKAQYRRKKIDVPLKFFLPFAEEASKEGDDALVDLWAHLLASSDAGTAGFDILCIDILKRIGREEVILLLKLDDALRSAPVLTGSVSNKLRDIAYGNEPGKLSSKKWTTSDMNAIEKTLLQERIFPIILCYKIETISAEMPSKFYAKHARTILALEKLGMIEHKRAKAQAVDIAYLVLSDLGSEVVKRCTGRGSSGAEAAGKSRALALRQPLRTGRAKRKPGDGPGVV